MRHRHKKPSQKTALPKIWLMTDPRLGDGLFPAIQKLPFGSGVIFRHYELPAVERQVLFKQVMRICRRRGHLIFLADDERTARAWHADGYHRRIGGGTQDGPSHMLHSAPVHSARELAGSYRNRADIIFVSPIYLTRSHVDVRPLGPMAFRRLSVNSIAPVVALGGMNAARARMQDRRVVHGWAAIDAFGNTNA